MCIEIANTHHKTQHENEKQPNSNSKSENIILLAHCIERKRTIIKIQIRSIFHPFGLNYSQLT